MATQGRQLRRRDARASDGKTDFDGWGLGSTLRYFASGIRVTFT